jgi:hypothetical protein
MALSVKAIARNLKQPGRYRDDGAGGVRGLMMQVSAPGAGAWILRYQRGVRTNAKGEIKPAEHWMGLGSVSDLTLAKARKLASEARTLNGCMISWRRCASDKALAWQRCSSLS